MKLLILFIFVLSMFAQTPTHQVTLTWTDAINPVGTTYNIYRVSSTCASPTFGTAMVTGVVLKTYVDATVVPGNYCYAVTAFLNNSESGFSPTALAPVPSAFPPGKILIIVQ